MLNIKQSRNCMDMKRWIILTIILVVLMGCAKAPETAEVIEQAIPDEQTVLSPSNLQTGVTILADGSVQAAQPPLSLAFETSGRLIEVVVRSGDQVQSGDILARLEGSVPLDSFQAAVTSAELSLLRAQQALDVIHSTANLTTAQAQMNLAVAQEELLSAEYRLQVQQGGNRASGDTIAAAEANLVLAELQVEQAQVEFNKYAGRSENDPSRALALSNLVAARQQRDAILRNLNWYTGSPTDISQALLDAEVAIAQAQLELAEMEWEAHKNGPDPIEVAMAESELVVAQDLLTRSQNDLQKAIDAVVLIAPMDGTVLNVEGPSGALVGSGSPILTLLDTTQLEFHTTNVSERDLGGIFSGQSATVTLKTYPNQSIGATVVRIGWQASGSVGDAATFPVILLLRETDLIIRPGMTGRVEIHTDK
jgi:multidrug efflux pump subunit AcrA (membrane-fusion protein)